VKPNAQQALMKTYLRLGKTGFIMTEDSPNIEHEITDGCRH
jgi:hypothetical protein